MAEVVDGEVEVGPDEVLVKRKVVRARPTGGSVLAMMLLLTFLATCGVVFFGKQLGLTQSGLATVKVIPQPQPLSTG